MIKRIFIFISRKLNTIIKFINLRILKRKKAITVIEFLYLAFSKFQQTKLFKLLVFKYKIVGIFITLVTFGTLYKENYNLNDLNGLLGKIKVTLITIYNILYNTIYSIYILIFKRNNNTCDDEDITPEPMEDYYVSDIKIYLFKEETPWYQDWYIIAGLLIMILCIGSLTYSNWDSDSNIKDNIYNMGSDIFNIMKEIKNKIINFFNIRRNQGGNDNSSDDTTSETNSYFRDELDLSRVDSRILSDPYLYPFFKHLHNKEDWPMYGSSEHATILTKTFNSSDKNLIHTYEHISNLYDSIVKMADNNVKLPSHMVDKFQNIMDKASEEYYTWKSFNDVNITPTETTPKASTSNLVVDTPKASTSTLPDVKSNLETSFESNLRGQLKNKSVFDFKNESVDLLPKNKNDSSSLLTKTVDFIKSTNEIVTDSTLDEPLFNERAFDLHIDNNQSNQLPPAPPAPPAPSAPVNPSASSAPTVSSNKDNQASSSNPLLNSINSFSKNNLKKATTVIGKKFDAKGQVIGLITENNEDNPLDVTFNTLVNETEFENQKDFNNSMLKNEGDLQRRASSLDNVNKGKNKEISDSEALINFKYREHNKDKTLDDIKDLQSEIWKRTFKNEGYDLHSDGTFTKINNNNNKPSVSDSNPLTHALSDQLDKMIINETVTDEIKPAPSWDNDNTNENEFNESNISINKKEKLKAKKGINLKIDLNTWKNLPEDFKNAKLPPKAALTESQEAIVQDFDKSYEMYKLLHSVKKFDKNKLNEVEIED
jgi:hypothetical protein